CPARAGAAVAGAPRRARANLESLGRAVDAGCDVVVPGPSCSRAIKQEYPLLVPGEATERVVRRVFDLAEYLMKLHAEGRLAADFGRGLGRVPAHRPA